MNDIVSFHGNDEIKDAYLHRVEKYGCEYCITSTDTYKAWEDELGIPAILGLWHSIISERLQKESKSKADLFNIELIKSIPVGVDLKFVYPNFFNWTLTDDKLGAVNLLKRSQDVEKIKNLAKLYYNLCIKYIDFDEFKSSIRPFKVGIDFLDENKSISVNPYFISEVTNDEDPLNIYYSCDQAYLGRVADTAKAMGYLEIPKIGNVYDHHAKALISFIKNAK